MNLHVRLAFSICAVLCPISVAADPIIGIYSSRHVTTLISTSPEQQIPLTESQQNEDALNLMSSTNVVTGSFAATAILHSNVSGTDRTFSGNGTASGEITDATGGAFGFTNYVVGFRLTRPQQFSFDGTFNVNRTVVLQDAWILNFFSEEPPPFSDIFFVTGRDTRQVARSGLLPAGAYSFQVITSAGTRTPGANSIDHSFSLSFADPGPTSSVPEPSSILLLTSGAAGLFASSRRKWAGRLS